MNVNAHASGCCRARSPSTADMEESIADIRILHLRYQALRSPTPTRVELNFGCVEPSRGGVQSGEFVLAVTFGARRAADLAAGGDRNRAGRHQHPFVMRTELRRGQWNRDEAGLHRAENPDDVFKALRSEDRHAITRRSAGRQFRGNDL